MKDSFLCHLKSPYFFFLRTLCRIPPPPPHLHTEHYIILHFYWDKLIFQSRARKWAFKLDFSLADTLVFVLLKYNLNCVSCFFTLLKVWKFWSVDRLVSNELFICSDSTLVNINVSQYSVYNTHFSCQWKTRGALFSVKQHLNLSQHRRPKLRMWINYSIAILLRNVRFIEIVWEIYLYANYS